MSTLLRATFSRPTSKIDLVYDNKVTVTFRSSEIGFLKGLDQSKIEKIVLKEKGTVLYWPELDKSIILSDLLKILLGG